MKQLLDRARKEKVRAILVQKQFPKDVALSIAKDLNIKVIQIDPLAYDWFNTMDEIEKAIAGK
jgi:zinc transport system substrate-binding protein